MVHSDVHSIYKQIMIILITLTVSKITLNAKIPINAIIVLSKSVNNNFQRQP